MSNSCAEDLRRLVNEIEHEFDRNVLRMQYVYKLTLYAKTQKGKEKRSQDVMEAVHRAWECLDILLNAKVIDIEEYNKKYRFIENKLDGIFDVYEEKEKGKV